MTRWYLIGMIGIFLADRLDRLWEKYGEHSTDDYVYTRDKWLTFGSFETPRGIQPRRQLKFLRLKLPIRTWGSLYPNGRPEDYGFREHYLHWVEGKRWFPACGWRIEPPLEES